MKHTVQETRKITVNLPVELVEGAMRFTGVGVTDTLKEALRRYNHIRACEEFMKLRGKVKFDMTWQELRGKDSDRDLEAFLPAQPRTKRTPRKKH